MWFSKWLPKIPEGLRNQYRQQCNDTNLVYVWYLSLLACCVFSFHLLHHFRLGTAVFDSEMLPYTVLYLFGVIYPLANIIILAQIKSATNLVKLANSIELFFPFFMVLIAVLLSYVSVSHQQGITPFTGILMLCCFMLHGQTWLLVTVVSLTFMSLSGLLWHKFPLEVVSPHIANAFTVSVACIGIAIATERQRIRQFLTMQALEKNNEQLKLLSSQDHLTGLLNRRAIDAELEREMARSERFGHPLSLLIVDVDNFKQVNDAKGHLYGDDVLKGVSRAIQMHIRDVDFVGRLGGDEFVVILIETSRQQSLQIAERMRVEVENSINFDGESKITISIGYAQYTGEGLAAFIERADKALYSAKRSGKNKVRSSMH